MITPHEMFLGRLLDVLVPVLLALTTVAFIYDKALSLRRRKPMRPAEPAATHHVWYRGWEIGYDHDAAYWGGTGWRAYKGGCDLDAPEVMAATYAACLDEIDEAEDD